MGYRLGIHSSSISVELVKFIMSPDDKTPSVSKKSNAFTASEGSKLPAAEPTQVKNVYKRMAAIAAANGTTPYALSAKHKKLLDRQALLIEVLREQGVSGGPAVAPTVAPKLPSKSSIQDVAKRVGIWTPSGKLSSSYKK